MQTKPKPSPRRRSSLLWLGLLSVLLAPAAYQFRAQSRFERYVSPPLDPRGTRLDLLIPRGWQRVDFHPSSEFADTYKWLRLESPKPLRWLPSWSRRWLHLPNETGAVMFVGWYYSPETVATNDVIDEAGATPGGYGAYGAIRLRPIPGRGYWAVHYSRGDEQAFSETHKAILENVRVR